MNGAVTSIAFLLLQFLAELQALDYQCSKAVFPRCINNPVLSITKSSELYQVTLHTIEWQCYNEFCLVANYKNRANIMCNDIYGACQRLHPPGTNGKHTVSMHTYLARMRKG